MKIQMTQRDRKLLVFLGVMVAVVVIGYWGIRPLMKDTAQIKEQIEEQKAIKEENELKMSEYALLKRENEKFEKEIDEMLLMLEPMKSSAQIDKELTDRILKKKLRIQEMIIKMPKEDMVSTPYRYAKKQSSNTQQSQPVSTAISLEDYLNGDVTDTVSISSSQTKTGVYCAKVSMVIKGERTGLEELLEEFYSYSPCILQVKSYAFGQHADYEETTEDSLSVQLELYFRAGE